MSNNVLDMMGEMGIVATPNRNSKSMKNVTCFLLEIYISPFQ